MSSPAVRPPCSPSDAGSYWEGTTFSSDKLPRRPALGSSAPASFTQYLSADLLLPPGDYLETCRDSWAFAVSAALQCALTLQYARLGLRFTNRSMSSNYLLSCFDIGPADMCGCLGCDLPAVYLELSRVGLVTFSQFPYYTSEDLGRKLYADIDVEYFCRNRDLNGSCKPCASAAEYQEVVLAASRDQGSFRFLVPCLPCTQPQVPRYYPSKPFVLDGGGRDEEQAEAVRRELVRLGPLCVAISLDLEAFSSLFSGGSPPVVDSVERGLFYTPRASHVASAHLQAVLLVAYRRTSGAAGAGDGGASSDAAFWVCQSPNGSSNFGYALNDRGTLIRGLFNVAMLDVTVGLLDRVLSFERMLIQTEPKVDPRDLGPDDPFVTAERDRDDGPSPATHRDGYSVKNATSSDRGAAKTRERRLVAPVILVAAALCILALAVYFLVRV